jgi:ribosomal subunit interface protein
MDIRIRATDYEMTPEVSNYLDQRIATIEKMLADRAELARCEVEIGRDAGRPRHGKNIYFAEVQIHYPGQPLIRATNHSESINGAIDDVKEEIERQLRREKKLHIRMWRKSGATLKRLMRIDRE